MKHAPSCVVNGVLRHARSTVASPPRERNSSRPSPIFHPKTSNSSGPTSTHISIRRLALGPTNSRGLLDTSVVIALGGALSCGRLPDESFVSTLTLAELAEGPAAATDELVRARRLARLRRAETSFRSLSFDRVCVSAYARVSKAVVAVGRKTGGSRSLDLLIAATALHNGLPLYTLNPKDLRGLDGLIEIVDLRRA